MRKAQPDSFNTGWRNSSFRGFADYMQTAAFEAGIASLLKLAERRRAAVMCAEAVPWRCHRSLIADALVARGLEVVHLMSSTQRSAHTLNPMAKVHGLRVTYPSSEETKVPRRRKATNRAGK